MVDSDATAVAVSTNSRTNGDSESVRQAIDSVDGAISETGTNANPGRP
jgi:hypothetical protein